MIEVAANAVYWLAGVAGTGVVAFLAFLWITRPLRRR